MAQQQQPLARQARGTLDIVLFQREPAQLDLSHQLLEHVAVRVE